MESVMVEVSGGSYDRGTSQGVMFAKQIVAHLDALYAHWSALGIESPETYGKRFLAETDFGDAVAVHTPHAMEEVNGIANGAGIDSGQAFLLQLLDEEWAYRARRLHTTPLDKCSSLAVRDNAHGVTYVGQNMDLPGYTDGFQHLVRHSPSGPAPGQVIFTIAGILGLMGTNAAGLGICVNSLPQLPSGRSGIPVAFMIRRLLESSSASEAAELIHRLPHATNQHYLLADPNTLVSLEASANGVTEYRAPWPDRIFHTNHPLSPLQADTSPELDMINSEARLAALTARLSRGSVDPGAIEAALSSRDDPVNPVCKPRSASKNPASMTTGSLVSALYRSGRVSGVVSMGPPSERHYESWRLI